MSDGLGLLYLPIVLAPIGMVLALLIIARQARAQPLTYPTASVDYAPTPWTLPRRFAAPWLRWLRGLTVFAAVAIRRR